MTEPYKDDGSDGYLRVVFRSGATTIVQTPSETAKKLIDYWLAHREQIERWGVTLLWLLKLISLFSQPATASVRNTDRSDGFVTSLAAWDWKEVASMEFFPGPTPVTYQGNPQ